jgi:hypothetical protein
MTKKEDEIIEINMVKNKKMFDDIDELNKE